MTKIKAWAIIGQEGKITESDTFLGQLDVYKRKRNANYRQVRVTISYSLPKKK